ncbi:protein DpdE [Schauerella aestuarii]|uniref:protein DpdE n=1 Tax=Schauerella aestuarii TaxID=2511204 RepID=UPI001369084B|nr:protein DpdE [Achromobacter aestuarii]MYZ42453.1 DEAD/DEAH box helicase [Achromobacter aestuarii]
MAANFFCWIKSRESEGLGKIVEVQGDTGVVEYFDSPADAVHHRVSVPYSCIRRKRLGRNMRVFTLDEMSNQWTVARVLDDDGEGIEVRLPHKQDVYLPYERVFVRWKRPIEDPVDFLGNLITETPQYAQARSGFIRNYVFQRGAAFGISALLSSSIELEPHQVEVVRRVLTDHTQRYLLADEVGLGKTIEAGIIIRQTVLDDMRGHRILILVPSELITQWREELSVRFGLSDLLDESIFVLSQDDAAELKEVSRNISLLVVDEAHHLCSTNADDSVQSFYQLVKENASRAERLLLLSATPILRNESGFLRMLNLLDPVVYRLDDVEGFRTKVSNRQTFAETVAALDPGNALFMDSVLDELLNRLSNDPRLIELSLALKEQLLDMPDKFDPKFCASVGQLRAHISETYRLNRRILRNRRTQVEGLTPERKGAEVWRVEASSMNRVESALENWRVCASLETGEIGFDGFSELADFYWTAVCVLAQGPEGLSRVCIERLRQISIGVLVPFDGESSLLETILQTVDTDSWLDRRLETLYQGLGTLTRGTKAVIFCGEEGIADRVFHYLKDRKLKIVRHEVGDALDFSEQDSWRDFLSVPEVLAIVCGPRAEEGINLQGGNKALVHFDLPLQPNRIEQRMGRVDRYGAGRPVRSFVLLDGDASFQMAWFRILNEGLGVFERSISSLQYLVEEEISDVAQSLIHEGVDRLDSLLAKLAGSSGLVARELRLIAQQDALDQLSPVPEHELDDLFDADADWRNISKAMTDWIENTLLFEKVKLTQSNGDLAVDDPFRFHYCPPDARTGRSTLISLSEFLDGFLGAIDFEAPGNRSNKPQSYPYVAHRPSAVKHRVRPLRYGTEFVESIRSFCELDVRGRSFAMWRQVPNEFRPMETQICFRFDFIVEADLDEALDVLAQARSRTNTLARASLARRGDTLFCPTVIQVWLNEEGDELPAEFVKRYLDPEYAKQGGDGYIDKNLDAAYLHALRRWSPNMLANWSTHCERMRDKAISIVNSKPELLNRQKDSLERALAEGEIRHARLRTRIESLDGREAVAEVEQFALERALSEALHQGISSPSLKVDVAGVVVLTSEPVSILSEHMRETR